MKIFRKLFILSLIVCFISYDVVALRELQSVPTAVPSNYSEMVYDTLNEYGNEWQTVSMVTEEMKNKGHTGGEGGQRMVSLAISKDGQFLMTGTDVAGNWRSVDGGLNWEPVYGGFLPTGCFSIEIDPKNSNRVLAFGGSPVDNASENGKNGIYLSEDKGEHWTYVLQQRGACVSRDFRESIAFDPTSYDPINKKCMVAYWSRPWRLQGAPSVAVFNDESKLVKYDEDVRGLWKTTDGGETWKVVNTVMSDGVVKVNPQNGTVYVGNMDGFHRSTDGGVNFTTVISGKMVYGLDVIDSYPNRVYINDNTGVKISDDSGKTFKTITSSSFPKSYDITNPERIVRNLKVSPANPQNMVVADFQGSSRYVSQKYYSKDGGSTWAKASYDDTDSFFKANNRDTCYVWHPTNPDKLWAFGGDWIVSSNNAGKTYKWDFNGGSAVCVPSRTIFNVYDPNLFYYGSQDFHGALTTDGGKTWKHIWKAVANGTSQGWGCVYGAYAADEKTLIALVSTDMVIDGIGNGTAGWSGLREIRVSRDGGESWTKTGVYKLKNHKQRWSEKCYQSPTDKNVLFAGNFRSDDYGYTWEEMTGCSVVQTHNPYGKKELYGSYKNTVVVSYDSGVTWQTYTTVKTPDEYAENPSQTVVWDIAYDGVNDILYYVSGNASIGIYLCKVQKNTTIDITKNIVVTDLGKRFHLVSVDPRYPDVVYVGGNGGGGNYIEENSVQRSCDGGNSFYVLSRNGQPNSIVESGIASGFIVRDLIVNPVDGYLWVNNGVRGWSKIAPPYKENEFKNLIKDGDMENISSKLFYSKYADQNVGYVTDKALTENTSNKVLCFDNSNSANASNLYYDLNMDKGHTYCFSFDYRADGSQAVDMVTEFGGETKKITATNKWQNVFSTFTATSDKTSVSICAKTNANVKYYIDNWKLYDMTESIKVDSKLPDDCKINCIFGIDEINGQLYANKNSKIKFSLINGDDLTAVSCGDKIINSVNGVYTVELGESDVDIRDPKEMYIEKENGLPTIYTGNEKSFIIIAVEREGACLNSTVCSFYNSNEINKKIVLGDVKEFSQIKNWENREIYVWRNFGAITPLCVMMK